MKTRRPLITGASSCALFAATLQVAAIPVEHDTLWPQGGAYLSFLPDRDPPQFGQERTGWTDRRHPAYFLGAGPSFTIDVTDDHGFGYDWSDHRVFVNNTVVNEAPLFVRATTTNIFRDYHFANQIYSQIGISVHVQGIQQRALNVTSPIDDEEDNVIRAANRQSPPTINNYYVRGIESSSPEVMIHGRTHLIEGGVNPGILISDTARNDTFAHELGHFLLDQYWFDRPQDQHHSDRPRDLMAAGDPRAIPGNTEKGVGIGNDAPSEPGHRNGNIGGVSLFEAYTTQGGQNVNQIAAIYATASDGTNYVQKRINGAAGDRIDFDWVEDSNHLEIAGGGPDDVAGKDYLWWGQGALRLPDHDDHMHQDQGPDLPPWDGDIFRQVDVFSQICRYTDMDVDAIGNWSPRASAFDYSIEFSLDGVSWGLGLLTDIWKPGWTYQSEADDYVARYWVDGGARYVRIKA
ncbi:MAG TPA: hypothetical protein VI136_16745, partial [Verrucomicrobiae bacterium]